MINLKSLSNSQDLATMQLAQAFCCQFIYDAVAVGCIAAMPQPPNQVLRSAVAWFTYYPIFLTLTNPSLSPVAYGQ